MLFRIYIPALEPGGVSMTIDVEAQNWMLALRYGLDEVGESRELIKRAICDIKPDKTIHVTEPEQGRVFVLREVPAAGDVEPELPTQRATTVPLPEVKVLREAAVEAALDEDVPWFEPEPPAALPMGTVVDEQEDPLAQVVTQELPRFAELEEMPLLDDYDLDEGDLEKYFDSSGATPPAPTRTISHLDLDAVSQERPQELKRAQSAELSSAIRTQLAELEAESSDLLASIFEEMAGMDFFASTIEDALQYALELAVDRVPSEAGWLLLADMNRSDLYVATAFGPKAEEVIKYRLPMGRGIAGFCAVNAVSLTLSDVEQDPRFQTMLSRSVGLKIDSVCCAPIQHEGRVFGAIQIMNHLRRQEYTSTELDALNYIACRTAEYLATNVRM